MPLDRLPVDRLPVDRVPVGRVTVSPTLIDPRGARFAAGVTTAVLAVTLLTESTWLLVAQVAMFALGVAGRSPYGVLFRLLLRPRLAPPTDLEDARPVRFAQAVGLGFVALALTGVALGSPLVATAFTAAALSAALLNAALGICLGCEVYLLFRRTFPSTAPRSRKEVPA